MDFTIEQENALNAKGNILVSAAAGSGKTAVLTERVANIICDEKNPVDADKLMVVTFTNAAAAEMRSRINEKLYQRLLDNPKSVYLRRQKMLIAKANICTTDSFCINLVREYFYKLDISADYTIMTFPVEIGIRSKCFDEVFEKYFEEMTDDFRVLCEKFGNRNLASNLKMSMESIFKYVDSLAFCDEFFEKSLDIYKKGNIEDWLKFVFEKAFFELNANNSMLEKALHNDEYSEAIELFQDTFDYIHSQISSILSALKLGDYDSLRKLCGFFAPPEPKAIKTADKSLKAQIKSLNSIVEDIKGCISEIHQSVNLEKDMLVNECKEFYPAFKAMFSFYNEYSDLVWQEKLKENSFSFSDIERLALELLVKKENGKLEYTSIAKELSNRYHSVLVDEYQDTNNLQDTIFRALSDDGKKLFMVGDVKQSIYRFRRANPDIFLNYKESFPTFIRGKSEESENSKVIMSGNFRSAPQICDFINFIFEKIMTKNTSKMDYLGEDKLVAKGEFQEIDIPRVQLNLVIASGSKSNKSDAEIQAIANKILELKGQKIVRDGKELRDAEFRDFAILVRSRSCFRAIKDIFDEAKIPVLFDKNENLLHNAEVKKLISFLKIIDNPYNDVDLLCIALSNLYGFTADEIAKMRIASKHTNLFTALLKYSSQDEKTQKFVEELESLRRFALSSSVSELITRIFDITGMLNIARIRENGELCVSDLMLFREMASDYESTTSLGLSSFMRYVSRLIDGDADIEEASVLSESQNVVRVMTIHKSKGLQFPICILAKTSDTIANRDTISNLVISEKSGVAIKNYDIETNSSENTLPREAVNIENNNERIGEELRLLYVALTRAADVLIVSGTVKDESSLEKIMDNSLFDGEVLDSYLVKNSVNYLKWLLYCMPLHPQMPECMNFIKEAREKCDVCINVVKPLEFEEENVESGEEIEANEEFFEQLKEILSYKYKYENLNSVAAKQSASSIAHSKLASSYSLQDVPNFIAHQKLSAAQKGTAMHAFLCFIDFKKASEDFESEFCRAKDILSEEELKSLDKDKIKAFLNSPICEKIINSSAVYKEKEFMVELPAKLVDESLPDEFENEKIVIQGFVDLCFIKNNEIIVVDYKTDRVDDINELSARYSKQLDIYALALSRVFELKVSQKFIYSIFLSDELEIK